MGVRRPLVLTGGPAVGKTTCGRALAQERPRAAYLDVDDEALHRADAENPPEADVVLHVDGLTIEEQVKALWAIWDRAST